MPRFTSSFLADFVDYRPITKSALLVNEIHMEENIDRYKKKNFRPICGQDVFCETLF